MPPLSTSEAEGDKQTHNPLEMPVMSRRMFAKAMVWAGLFYAVVGCLTWLAFSR